MRCEICGARIAEKAYRVYVDRAELLVCKKCAEKFGTPVRVVGAKSPSRTRVITKTRYPRELEYSIVENCAELVREARERMGLTRSLLASMVGEKESTIRRIEDGSLEPTLDLARKLERVLKVRLVVEEAEYESEYAEGGGSSEYDLTLGDVVVFKKK